MTKLESFKKQYATIEKADSVLSNWSEVNVLWRELDNSFKQELLIAASLQIDDLPFFPEKEFKSNCQFSMNKKEHLEVASIIQAAHIVLNTNIMVDKSIKSDEYESRTFMTICYDTSNECIEYSLGALLVLEKYIDIDRLDKNKQKIAP